MEGRIEGIGKGGNGILFFEGKPVFIPYVVDGELIEFEITGKKHSVYFGELKKIIEVSSKRAEPFCTYFGKCGGCNFQHIQYEHQLNIKKKILEGNLKKIAKLKTFPKIEIIPSRKDRNYRTKLVLKIRDGKLGFFKRNSNDFIEIEKCPLAENNINMAILKFKDHPKVKETKKAELFILSNGRDISAAIRRNRDIFNLTENREVKFSFSEISYLFSPLNFIQSNIFNLETMLELLKEEAIKGKYNTGSDLFSGVGFFSIYISKYFEKIYSYESEEENIKAQKKNIKLNNLKNIEIIRGDIAKKKIKESDFFVVDPPRGGITGKLVKKIVSANPKKIVYFSCDSATFSRDIFYFSGENYSLKKLTILDNFPQTDHFEIFSVLEKSS